MGRRTEYERAFSKLSKIPKFIFITGGVVSSLGKGVAGAAIAALLEARGLKVAFQKLDPYLNVDPGTMSPYQHGEVFVTEDGTETDLDLGHYERFSSAILGKNSNFTTGQIYLNVIDKERSGNEYLGKTVQIVPHVTDEIKLSIIKAITDDTDILIGEIGGTIGDIESLPFLEAIRQLKDEVGHDNFINIHLTLVPYLSKAKEVKTKPTQHSVKELRSIGIKADILLCRSEEFLDKNLKNKIALHCSLPSDAVVSAKDTRCIYEIPLLFHKEGLDEKIVKLLSLPTVKPRLSKWKKFSDNYRQIQLNPNAESVVKIGVVGKYTEFEDSYKSLNEALVHGSIANSSKVILEFIDSTVLNEKNYKEIFKPVDGILVPGGFGDRGIDGKILAAQYARQELVPYFGICLGMHIAVIEFARNVVKYKDAHSTEFCKETPYPVIFFLEKWFDERQKKEIRRKPDDEKGGTMRLGAYPSVLKKNSFAYRAYKKDVIEERHRHRFEFNLKYKEVFEKAGLVISGISPKKDLVEIVEIKKHPWFLGCQFHPEFKSSPLKPHPLFRDFIKAAKEYILKKS